MALVLKNDMVPEYLNEKMAVTDGVATNVTIDGVKHVEIITYPAQENFPEGAILGLIQKPFIDFAASCGGKGAMTVEMIKAKYGDQIPEVLAKTFVDDFALAYGNYVIIPDGMSLAITASPIKSIFDLLIPEKPVIEESKSAE